MRQSKSSIRNDPRVDSEMLFSAPHVFLALRWVPPIFAIVGSSATYITIWAVLRGARWPLTERVYQRLEEKLYSAYQALIGFLFETWSGVEVRSRRGECECGGEWGGEESVSVEVSGEVRRV